MARPLHRSRARFNARSALRRALLLFDMPPPRPLQSRNGGLQDLGFGGALLLHAAYLRRAPGSGVGGTGAALQLQIYDDMITNLFF